jgi:hypothetical protein
LVYKTDMLPIQVSDRVEVYYEKYQGFGLVAEFDEKTLLLQKGPLDVIREVPREAVTSVDSTQRLRRESFERAFKVVDYIDPKPDPLFNAIKQVGTVHDLFLDSFLDTGPEGHILYVGPSGVNLVSVLCSPNCPKVVIIPFVSGSLVKIPDGIKVKEGKELSIVPIHPFKVSAEIIDEDGHVAGIRNKNQELYAVQERLQALLRSCSHEMNPLTVTMSELDVLDAKAQEWGITWVHTGNFKDGLLETIPHEPGRYLCGNGPAGLLYKLPDNRFCMMLDSRKCRSIEVKA